MPQDWRSGRQGINDFGGNVLGSSEIRMVRVHVQLFYFRSAIYRPCLNRNSGPLTMTVEALWTVRFGDGASDQELNGGVAVLETGRIFGGDSAYAYVGRYQVSGDELIGDLRVIMHNSSDDFVSLYNTREPEFRVSFDVRRRDDGSWEGVLARAGHPNARLILRRLAELP